MEHITEEEARPALGRKPTLVIWPEFLEELKRELVRSPKKPVLRYSMSEFLYKAHLPRKYEKPDGGAYLAYRLSNRYRPEGLVFSSRSVRLMASEKMLVYDSSREARMKKGGKKKRELSKQ